MDEPNKGIENSLEWLHLEANGIIKDIGFAVKDIVIDQSRSNAEDLSVLLNIKTIENNELCVEMTTSGFCLKVPNNISDEEKYFETIYSLLSKCSPGYNLAFGSALCEKLQKLKDLKCRCSF